MQEVVMRKWIGREMDTYRIGEIGFLVSREHHLRGTERWDISEHPAHTNMSHAPRLTGWCGTSNDVAVYAHGLARVVRIAKNGRALVERLAGEAEAVALEDLGYPDLAE